jgi:hypothetical protein
MNPLFSSLKASYGRVSSATQVAIMLRRGTSTSVRYHFPWQRIPAILFIQQWMPQQGWQVLILQVKY